MPLFSNLALEYVIRKDQENQMGLKLNDTQNARKNHDIKIDNR
jgi:hypothetical protein